MTSLLRRRFTILCLMQRWYGFSFNEVDCKVLVEHKVNSY